MKNPALRRAALRGARWIVVSRTLAEIAMFSSSVALARLIPPAEYGRAAIALVASSVGSAMMGGLVGTPLVRLRDVGRREFEAAQAVAVAAGIVLTTLGLFVVAPALSQLVDSRTGWLFAWMTPVFLLASGGAVPHAMLQRELRFKAIAMIEVTALLSAVAITLFTAIFVGWDGPALVAGTLTGTFVSAGLAALVSRPVRVRWHNKEAAELGVFGAMVGSASLMNDLARNIDYAIIGAVLKPQDVGVYWRGYQVGVEWQAKLYAVISRMSFPLLARAEDLEAKRRVRFGILRIQATIVLPLLALLIASSGVFIPWVFGPLWSGSVTPARILAFAGMASVLKSGVDGLLLAAGHARAVTAWAAFNLVSLTALVLMAAPHGISATSVAVAGQMWMSTLVVHIIAHRRVGSMLVPSLRIVAGPACASMLAGITTFGIVKTAPITPGLLWVVACLCGAGVYAAVLRRFDPRAWAEAQVVLHGLTSRTSRQGKSAAS